MEHLFPKSKEDKLVFIWQTDKKYCPNYLEEFHLKDKTWPNDKQGALDEYHYQKVLYFLKNALLLMSDEERKKVWKYFPESVNPYQLNDVLKFEVRDVLKERLSKNPKKKQQI